MSLMIECPVCGRRDGYEFRYGGEEKGPRPAAAGLSPERWCDWVHLNDAAAGVQHEWWCHRDGCGTWFTIWRDTTTNRQVRPPLPDGTELER